MTVREAVLFSARLRLAPEHARRIRAFVAHLLDMLELADVADRQVGSLEGAGLSFEQRKRLTMAVELAANPAILFLDEPTSGLDSRAAIVVTRAVRTIAATGRSVICTIHQPSYALFSVFDRLLLLKKGGQTVYFGDLGQDCGALVAYLGTAGRALGAPSLGPLDDGTNPATWMLAACTAPEDFASYYAKSPLAAENARARADAATVSEGSTPLAFATTYAASRSTQFTELVKRAVVNYYRSPSYNVTRGMVSIVIAVVIGSAYTERRPGAVNTFGGAMGRCGLVYIANFFMGIIFFASAVPAMAAERASYYREHASAMYPSLPYVEAFMVAEIPYLLFFSGLHVGVLWGFVDFFPGAANFSWYFLFYFLYVTLMTFFAQLLVACLPNEGTATAIGVAFLTITANVCGFAITPDKIPDYWLFAYWIAPVHYVFEGIVVTQYHGSSLRLDDIPGAPTLSRYFASHWDDSHFGGMFAYSHRWQNVAILLVMITVCRLLTIYCMHRVNYATK